MFRKNSRKLIALIMIVGTMLFSSNVLAATTVEDTYAANGSNAVSTMVIPISGQVYTNIKIYYPTNLTAAQYPVISFANGTGMTYANYEVMLNALASWGFIVCGNDDGNTASGETLLNMTNYVLALDSDPGSIFYGKLDESKVGAVGHSQGGAAVVNSAALTGGNIYKTICALSASQKSLISYDVTKINVPFCQFAGTGFFDAYLIAPLSSMQANYNGLPAGVPAVRARIKNTDHGDVPVNARGYITAWFQYILKGDTTAATAFKGTNYELSTNTGRWQDVATKNLP